MLKILASAAVVIGTLKVKMCTLIYLPVVSATVLPAKSDSDIKFCLQSYHRLRMDRSKVNYRFALAQMNSTC